MNDTVTLTFLAETRNVSLARTVAAAMSARADLPMDQLEDVRLAVDEAVTQLVHDAPAGSEVTCHFEVRDAVLDVRVSALSTSGTTPAQDTFSWTVLSALVDEVTASVEAGEVVLVLHISRHIAVDA